MPVGYGSSSSTGANDTLVSTINVPVPSGVVAGNHVYVALEQWESSNPTVTAPSGFVAVGSIVSGSQKLKVFVKEATGSDTGNYTFSWTGSQWTLGHAVRVTGAKAGNPTGANFNTASASGTAIPNTSVTVGFVPGLLQWSCNENGGTQTTPPTNFTEVQDSNYLHSNHDMTAAASGTFTAPNGVMSVSTLILAFLVAIEPAAGGGGAVALDGIGMAANGATGALSASRPLSGNASGSSSATGALSRSRPLDGAASAASSAGGSLSVARSVTGNAPASSSASGELTLAGSVSLDGSAAASASASGTITVSRGLTGSASAASSATGELSMVAPFWRLVMPAIPERHVIRGNLAVTINREATVFGDENGLYTTERGSTSEGSDDYGAIPFGTKYIWYGGHLNTTDDPAVKALWLAHGFEVESYVS